MPNTGQPLATAGSRRHDETYSLVGGVAHGCREEQKGSRQRGAAQEAMWRNPPADEKCPSLPPSFTPLAPAMVVSPKNLHSIAWERDTSVSKALSCWADLPGLSADRVLRRRSADVRSAAQPRIAPLPDPARNRPPRRLPARFSPYCFPPLRQAHERVHRRRPSRPQCPGSPLLQESGQEGPADALRSRLNPQGRTRRGRLPPLPVPQCRTRRSQSAHLPAKTALDAGSGASRLSAE